MAGLFVLVFMSLVILFLFFLFNNCYLPRTSSDSPSRWASVLNRVHIASTEQPYNGCRGARLPVLKPFSYMSGKFCMNV